MSAEANVRTPRVYVVYNDTRKDMSAAEKFGQLTNMFGGKVRYDLAVGQARKMLVNYQDGDYIMMVGDPALCAVTCAVALEYSDSETLQLLRWDREEIEYKPLEMIFSECEPATGPHPHDPGVPEVQVQKRNRWA